MTAWVEFTVGKVVRNDPLFGGDYIEPDLSGISGATGSYAVQSETETEYVVLIEVITG